MRLTDFLRTRRERVLAEWEREVRTLAVARALSRPVLRDHIPELLDRIVEALEYVGPPENFPLGSIPDIHALERLGEGFDLDVVVAEYRMLRACVLRLWASELRDRNALQEVMALNDVIDRAVAAAVDRYARVRERTFQALDAISLAALGESQLGDFLPKLMQVLVVTVPVVDTVAILLREGEMLHLRASVGLHQDLDAGFSVRIGEGFAGTIAAERCPRLAYEPGRDPLFLSSAFRSQNLRVVYGVPLLLEGEVLGVAHMGSLRSSDFSEEDKLLFRVMAHRATAIVAQKSLQDELHRARLRIELALEQMKRDAAFRERFMAILGHDLRTPLAAIVGTAEALLLWNALPEGLSPRIERIARSARRMERMIRDLLDFARTREGGGIPVAPERLALSAVCRSVVDEVEASNPERTVTLTTHGDCESFCDPDRIAQVVQNLLVNALDYSPRDTPVRVEVGGVGDRVLLRVTNDGAPIPEEKLSTLFDPWKRGEHRGEPRRAAEGLGLGLYIAQAIVHAHRGTIAVESTAAAGTTFTVSLPRAPAPG